MVSKVEKYGKSKCVIDFLHVTSIFKGRGIILKNTFLVFLCVFVKSHRFSKGWAVIEKLEFLVFVGFCQVASILKGRIKALGSPASGLSQINETVSCMCARGVQAGSMPN